jgi:hypothetical protein
MNVWKVTLEFTNDIKKELDLYDVYSYFNGYLNIKRTYFNQLAKTIKMTKRYNIIHGIHKVIGPDEEDWSHNPWMLFIISDNEKENPYWLFIKREKDLSGSLVAIGPKTFADFNNSNQDNAKRDIKRLINYLVTYINKFYCSIVLPNYL